MGRMMDAQPLAGRTVAVPETRELEVFAAMLERRGASVVRCPLIAIRDAPDPAPVLAFARGFAEGSCDDLILTTNGALKANQILAKMRISYTMVKCHRRSLIPRSSLLTRLGITLATAAPKQNGPLLVGSAERRSGRRFNTRTCARNTRNSSPPSTS